MAEAFYCILNKVWA